MTVGDRYPLQRMDDMFDALGGSTIFSTVDAAKGYHQLDIAEEDQWKTAFTCHKGLFEYTRIPFGLKNAPSWFQRFMDGFLGGLRGNGALVYMDDVIVYSKSLPEHLSALKTILSKAIEIGLRFDPKKCHFGLTSLKLLGKLISPEGVSILPDKAEVIRRLSVPKTLHELHHIVGLFEYYGDTCPRLSELMAPLRRPLKKGRYVSSGNRPYFIMPDGSRYDPKTMTIEWEPDQNSNFEKLKKTLADLTGKVHADWSKRFFFYIDSSQKFYSGVIHQQFLVKHTGQSFAMQTDDLDKDQVVTLQKSDGLWSSIYSRLARGEEVKNYSLREELLVFELDDLICLPREYAKVALAVAHSGHPGFTRTHQKMSEQWYHPSMAELCRSWVKHCAECIRGKVKSKTPGSMIVDEELEGVPFHTIAMDLVTGLPKSNNQPCDACLVIVDTFTKTTFLRPLTTKASASDISRAIEDAVLRQGWRPSILISDSDLKFVGSIGRKLAERIGAELRPSVPYHQQANPAERQIQTMVKTLRVQMLDKPHVEWPHELPALELALNNTPNGVTGYAPYDLLYVHRPRLVETILENAGVARSEERWHFSAARVKQAALKALEVRRAQKARFDKKHSKLPDLKQGDLVMIRLSDRPLSKTARLVSKLSTQLDGPFKIKEVLSQHRYVIDLPDDLKAINPIFSIDQLQLVPPDHDGRPGLLPDVPGEEHEIERIVADRMFNGQHKQFLVKWTNNSRLTWEFEEDLLQDNASEAINDYYERVLEELGTPPLEDRPQSARHAERLFASNASSSVLDTDQPFYDKAADALDKPTRKPRVVVIGGEEYLLSEKPVAFSSRATEGRERELIGGDLEAAGLFWGWRKFAYYLEGSKVSIITDHAPLGPIVRAGADKAYTPRMSKLRTLLGPHLHNITFHYREGPQHQNVDALSRSRFNSE